MLVIDSIQTMWTQTVDAAPGTVTQVRGSAAELIRFAKRSGAAVILVGHVTKDGQIAGPRVVEHMVDAVLSFEGDGPHQFRILRAVKNRFGPTDEIGVFEMTGSGLREIANPSELFLSERELGSPGTAVFAGIEGSRPLLVEIQALVAPTSLGTPRRAVVGWDQNRLSMVLAVLEAHCGVRLSGHDVYLNVAGGLRIQEPAADLAAAAALVSSLANAALPSDAVYFGEISLSCAVRPVEPAAAMRTEARKLGFARAVIPEAASSEGGGDQGLSLDYVDSLTALVGEIAGRRTEDRRRGRMRRICGCSRPYSGQRCRISLYSRRPAVPITPQRGSWGNNHRIVMAWGHSRAQTCERLARRGSSLRLASSIRPQQRGKPEFDHANYPSRPDSDRRHADFGLARHDPRLHAGNSLDRCLGDRRAGNPLFVFKAAAAGEILLQQRRHRGRSGRRRRIPGHFADRFRPDRAVL